MCATTIVQRFIYRKTWSPVLSYSLGWTMATTTLFLIFLAFISFAYVAVASSPRRVPPGSRYPRGPPGKPLVGNLPDVSVIFTSPRDQSHNRVLHAEQCILHRSHRSTPGSSSSNGRTDMDLSCDSLLLEENTTLYQRRRSPMISSVREAGSTRAVLRPLQAQSSCRTICDLCCYRTMVRFLNATKC